MVPNKQDEGKEGHAMQQTETKNPGRPHRRRKRALEKFGSVEFKSAGATRKR